MSLRKFFGSIIGNNTAPDKTPANGGTKSNTSPVVTPNVSPPPRQGQAVAAPTQATVSTGAPIKYSINLGSINMGMAPFKQAPAPAPVTDPLTAAVNLHKQGQLDQAEIQYRTLLQNQPQNADALQYLGMLHLQRGQMAPGIDYLQQALAIAPQHFGALNNLGNAFIEQDQYAEALAQFDQALAVQPNSAVVWHNRGRALIGLQDYAQAALSLEKSLAITPDFADSHRMLPRAWQLAGQPENALSSAEKALCLIPQDPALHYARSLALCALDRLDQALSSLNQALALRPDVIEALADKGVILSRLNRDKESLQALDQALALDDTLVGAHFLKGLALSKLGRLKEALSAFDRVVELDPTHALAQAERGTTLKLMGQAHEARLAFDKALQLVPDNLELQLKHAVAWVPIIRQTADEVDPSRAHFSEEIQALIERVDTKPVESPDMVVGASQPFYLAYQDRNNKPLLSLYGDLCHRLMQRWSEQNQQALASTLDSVATAAPGKRRIGIFSAHIHEQSVWRAIVRGWVCELDRERFEVCVFYHGHLQDAETALAQARADRFEGGERSLADWVQCLQNAKLDVLLYPELGMDGMTPKLAAMRLAPVQMASWGHPDTSGLPTMDYYLSAELFESPDTDACYTEKLVRLPHLGCCFESTSAQPEPAPLESWGLRPDATLFVCPGTPFKYTPEHDDVLVRIAQRLPNAQFLFFKFELFGPLTEALMDRLTRVFAAQGLNPEKHLVLAPWQTRSAFYGVLTQAHAFLDTIGFSGFNTVMHAVDCATPIVTRQGPYMRGRLGSAILQRMDMGDWVCHSDDDYVELAVKLASSSSERQRFKQGIQNQRAVLYGDLAPIRAMESLLGQV